MLRNKWIGITGLAILASAVHGTAFSEEVVFQETFDGNQDNYTITDAVKFRNGKVQLRPDESGSGMLTSGPIRVFGYNQLKLTLKHQIRQLDQGEASKIYYSVDGTNFRELSSRRRGRGEITLNLRNVPEWVSQIYLRFEVNADDGKTEFVTLNEFKVTGEPVVAATDPKAGNTPACSDQIDLDSPILSVGIGSNANNTRNVVSPINSSNVSDLELKYAYASPATTTKRGAPTVTEQAIFFYGAYDLRAINRDTGCEYWNYISDNRFKSSSVLYVPEEGMVFVGDYKGYVHALDAKTGELIWKDFAGVEDRTVSHQGHILTGGMQYHNGKLIVPVSIVEVLMQLSMPCCENHGIVRAYHAQSGGDLWEYHTTEDAKMYDTHMGPSGAPSWATPTIDAERNSVLIGTGQNYSKPATKTSDAIISLDLDTGKENWVFQSREGDVWNAYSIPQKGGKDYDFGASPILLEDGSAIIAGDKGSIVYSLNPDNGQVNWKRQLGSGGTLGGVHWNMAVDDKRVYAGVSDISTSKVDASVSKTGDARPGVYALDLKTGDIIWENHPTHMVSKDEYPFLGGRELPSLFSAAVSVTNDVVFAGSLDGLIMAFHAETGETLWEFDSTITFEGINGLQGNGGTIDSIGAIVAGDNVLINSGYAMWGGKNPLQAGPGNALFVLQLKQ